MKKLLWHLCDGGLSALPGQYGFTATWGVSPVYQAFVTPVGRRGYLAQITGLPGRRGLWFDVGFYRRPDSARKACRVLLSSEGLL